ncbi:MAG: FAD-dependent oxidoreductase [Alphaproteobacteria bacterium]
MKSHVRVAVIGGGVVGCSVLYHLTRTGWTDVALIERAELTSGSTWHAAGGMHTLNSDPNVAKLQDYTIRLYKELEAATGQSCGIHLTGGIMLAGTPERMDFLRTARAKGKVLGMLTDIISPAEAHRLHPLMEPAHFLGALWDPLEGHVDPNGVTQAYAKAARQAGAEVYRHNPVLELRRSPDGWSVITKDGTIEAEHVVNCAGLWAREVGRMVGIELPILAMQHQYLITDTMPEVAQLSTELPHCIDFEGEAYMRQEGKGVVLGTYEQACVPWSVKETPKDFGHELLPPDLDRIAPSLEVAYRHFPPLAKAGVKRVINGPFTFAPDGNPLVGPVPGLTNFWVACGVMAGFSQGGGVGLTLAEWMSEGVPSSDVFAMDVARFGPFATRAYTRVKVPENYTRRFRITFPNEELPAARPHRTTPIFDRLRARGAVFGAAFGLEYPLWFAPEGVAPVETPTFRRSNAHDHVAAECRAVRERVGLLETANFGRYEVTGPDAGPWLDRLLANRLPAQGRMALTPLLSPKGRLIGDLTVARIGLERFLIFGSGLAETYHMRWFLARLPERGVTVRSLSSAMVGLAIAGPKARELLSRVTDEDVSNAALPFLAIRPIDVGTVPAVVGRISFTGELGYEIWVAPDYQVALYAALIGAGEDLGLAHFGGRALNSLRLEKSFGSWTREFTPDYDPFQAGLGRFVAAAKNDFIGRDAALAARDRGSERVIATLVLDDHGMDAWGDEPVLHDGKVVGWVTSGGYGHTVGASIALAYVPPALAKPEVVFHVELLGETIPARFQPEPLVDPKGARMRS